MSNRLGLSWFIVAVALSGLIACAAVAKPPERGTVGDRATTEGVGDPSEVGQGGTVRDRSTTESGDRNTTPFTCPYLIEKSRLAQALPPEAPEQWETVAGNLDRLMVAHQYFRKAELLRKQGNELAAIDCYERTRQLCPGSRYAVLATARLNRLEANVTILQASKVSEEEQEPKVESTLNSEKIEAIMNEVRQRRQQLLIAVCIKEAKAALSIGQLHVAAELADTALEINPRCEDAYGILYRVNRLRNRGELDQPEPPN